MSRIKNRIDLFIWQARFKTYETVQAAGEFISKKSTQLIKNEDGDTNFISIAIILAIVLLVAVAFIVFKNTVMGWFDKSTKELEKAMN